MERKGKTPDDVRTILRTNTTVIAAIMVKCREADAMICGTYGQYSWHLRHVLDVIGLKEGVRDVSALSTNTTVIAAIMVKCREADAMICGTYGQYSWHLRHVLDVIGLKEGVRDVSALSVLIMPTGTFFLCDTHVPDPSAEELVEMTLMSADVIRDFGVIPKVALLSHSSLGSSDTSSARKVRKAVTLLAERAPDLKMDGEMQGDAAMDEALRERILPNSRLSGQANLFVLPNLDAANCAFTLLMALGKGLPVGPILVGAAKPVHILIPSVTARGIVNMSAIAAVNAQSAGTTE